MNNYLCRYMDVETMEGVAIPFEAVDDEAANAWVRKHVLTPDRVALINGLHILKV